MQTASQNRRATMRAAFFLGLAALAMGALLFVAGTQTGCATVQAVAPAIAACAEAPAALAAEQDIDAALAKNVAAVEQVALGYASDVFHCAFDAVVAQLEAQTAPDAGSPVAMRMATLGPTPASKLAVARAYVAAHPGQFGAPDGGAL